MEDRCETARNVNNKRNNEYDPLQFIEKVFDDFKKTDENLWQVVENRATWDTKAQGKIVSPFPCTLFLHIFDT